MLSGLMRRLHKSVYESRTRVLVTSICPVLRPGDRLLDVGCGTGALARAIVESPLCPPNVQAEGLERVRRGNEAVAVREYDGRTMPVDLVDDQPAERAEVDLVVVPRPARVHRRAKTSDADPFEVGRRPVALLHPTSLKRSCSSLGS